MHSQFNDFESFPSGSLHEPYTRVMFWCEHYDVARQKLLASE